MEGEAGASPSLPSRGPGAGYLPDPDHPCDGICVSAVLGHLCRPCTSVLAAVSFPLKSANSRRSVSVCEFIDRSRERTPVCEMLPRAVTTLSTSLVRQMSQALDPKIPSPELTQRPTEGPHLKWAVRFQDPRWAPKTHGCSPDRVHRPSTHSPTAGLCEPVPHSPSSPRQPVGENPGSHFSGQTIESGSRRVHKLTAPERVAKYGLYRGQVVPVDGA